MADHPPLHPLEARLAAAWPVPEWHDVTVLLAVSGGADSIAMLRAIVALRTRGEGRVAAAHVNHQLRGNASAADEAFVVELCQRLGVPCEVGRVFVDPSSGHGKGREALARQARYRFLALAAARLGARFVVTAHTADDQAETILHRIIRGTGIRGLRGMARSRPLPLPLVSQGDSEAAYDSDARGATLIRPLLAFRHADLVAYLDDLGQPYRNDASNADLRFARNRIRHVLLPRLANELNPHVMGALLRLGTLAGELQEVVDTLVSDGYEQCVVRESAQAVRIDARRLASQPGYLVRQLLMVAWQKQGWPMQSMGFAQWSALEKMLLAGETPPAAQPLRRMFPGGVLAERRYGELLLSRG